MFDDPYDFISDLEPKEDDETSQDRENWKISTYFRQFSKKENKVKITIRVDKDVYD